MALTRHDIDSEMAAHRDAYRKRLAAGEAIENHPDRRHPPYRSSILRAPKQPPVAIDVGKNPELMELASPVFGERDLTAVDNDLTRQHRGGPVGERTR